MKIAESGEVFYRSPGAFVEYYKSPESTAETKDPEGWVATGDAGFFDPDNGHLRIIDRAKDVAKMTDGSMFAPKYVENKLKFYPNILECVVFARSVLRHHRFKTHLRKNFSVRHDCLRL